MELSVELLLEMLQEQIPAAQCHIADGCPLLGRPLLYATGMAVVPGQVYLTDRPAPALWREDLCAVYTAGAPAPAGGCWIRLEADLAAAFNAVQGVFDRFDRWEEALEQVLLRHGTLQDLLNAAQPALQNPLMLIGADFSLVAQAGEEDLPVERRIFEPGADSMELFNALEQDATYQQMQQAREPFFYPAHITGWRSWNLNITSQGYSAHRLILAEAGHPLRYSDGWLLSRLGPYVGYLLEWEQSLSPSDTSLHGVFRRILSDRTADYVEMSRQLSRLDWKADDTYFCLVFKVTYLDKRKLAANVVCNHIEKTYPYSCSFLFQEDIVTFFNTTKTGKSLDTIAGEMKYLIRESFLKAGYSRAMAGHGNLRRQYVQACIALDVGGRIKPYLWIHHFNSVAFPYLLEQSTRRLPGYMVSHEGLLALQRHDALQHTEYMKTLRTYLDRSLNAMQTAKDLFIHRSTFLYRLEKIKEILDSRLEDPDELLYLSLSFRLLDNEQKKQDQEP